LSIKTIEYMHMLVFVLFTLMQTPNPGILLDYKACD